jgi:GNAT superfamily N-acetyltransferase
MARASARMVRSTTRGEGWGWDRTLPILSSLGAADNRAMQPPDIEISTDRSRLDMELIYRCLKESYWAAERPREVVERSWQHSLPFGLYRAGEQLAFARVVTDYAVFAYLADVLVLPEHRGRGLGKMLVRAIVDHPTLRGMRFFLLRTRDAHGVYEQCGFAEIDCARELMVLRPR